MKKTLIFDFDGTIADTIPTPEKIETIFNTIAKKIGFNRVITKEQVEKFRENNLLDIIKELKIPFYKLPFIIVETTTHLKKDLAISNPIPEMPDALLKIKKLGFSLNIITSSKKEIVENFLIRHGLRNIFDAVHSQKNLFGKDKTIKSFLSKQKIDNKQAIYIGDEIRDIQAAKKSGMQVISVTWGFNNKKGLLKFSPDFLIEKPKELVVLLKKIH